MTGSVGLDGIRRRGTHAPRPASDAHADAHATPDGDIPADAPRTHRREDATARILLVAAIAAVVVLVVLLPATPFVGIVLLSAISLGVVAAFVRRGEDRHDTGETIEGLATKGYLVLANRVAPGLTGTIRHLVIGPGGVFVVETRDQPGRVRIRGDQLIIGRLSHSVASQLWSQVAAVSTTLGPVLEGTRASVLPLICMRHAEMPLLHRTVAGIPLLRESRLERRISRSPRVLDDATIQRLAELADLSMPRSSRRRADPDHHLEPVVLPTGMAVPASRS